MTAGSESHAFGPDDLSGADPNQQLAMIARAQSSTPLSADRQRFAEAVRFEGVKCGSASP